MKDVKEELELKIIKIFANNAEEVNDLYDYDKLVTHTAQEMRQELLTLIQQSNLRARIDTAKHLRNGWEGITTANDGKDAVHVSDIDAHIVSLEAQLKELEGSE